MTDHCRLMPCTNTTRVSGYCDCRCDTCRDAFSRNPQAWLDAAIAHERERDEARAHLLRWQQALAAGLAHGERECAVVARAIVGTKLDATEWAKGDER